MVFDVILFIGAATLEKGEPDLRGEPAVSEAE
jgi:hypothetical protein